MAERIADRFELVSLAGEGGMSRVFRAVDLSDGKTVAVKVMHRRLDEASAARFSREARVLANVSHPAIVRHVAHGTADGVGAFLVMEWVDGSDLRAHLRSATLSVEDAVTVATRIGGALAHLHAQGIVHRDVKPANVVLAGGTADGACLVDLGLARRTNDDDDVTHAGMLVGTPAYMAPEQVRGVAVRPPCDVFSLGCLLYRCLAGVPPFAANDVTAVLARVLLDPAVPLATASPRVPVAIAEIVDAMLTKDPDERPSLDAILAAFGGAQAAPRAVALSAVEQRVVSVVVARAVASASEQEETLELPAPASIPSNVLEIARRYEAELTVLPTGALVAVATTRGAATDLVVRSAQLALDLAAILGDVPIAVATGRAEVGERVPVGEAIDRAVRLAHAAASRVRIDDVTKALIGERFVCEDDASGTVLVRKREVDAARTLLGNPTPCVGRDVELAMLDGTLAQCAEDSVARAVLVTGPAGIGKSRVRYELLRRTAGRGDAQVWLARADSVGAGAPFGMAAQMVRRAAGILEGEPAAAQREKLGARVARRVPANARGRVATFLAEMIGVPAEATDDVQLQAARRDPMLMSDQIRRAFQDLVDAEAIAPLVIVLEDLHWGDLPTVSVLDSILRTLADKPIFVVAFARPEIERAFPEMWRARGVMVLPLAPLSKAAATRLVELALGRVASADVARSVVERAGGNAFYLEELIRAVAEGRGDEAPESVVAMVQSRLQALDVDARRVLRAASVFGQTAWTNGIRALSGTDDVERVLGDLAARELLTRRATSRIANEVEYTFRHALVREGAYAMLTDADKTLGHRLAGKWLEAAGEPSALVIAEHFDQGGDPASAGPAFARAAQEALARNDHVRAMSSAERALAHGVTGELRGIVRLVQADVLRWRGDSDAVEASALEAMTLLPAASAKWGEAAGLLGLARQRLGHGDALGELGRELSRELRARGRDFGSVARATARIANYLYTTKHRDLAESLLADAEAATRDADDIDARARIHGARAMQAAHAGRPAEYLEHIEACELAFREMGDERMLCNLSVNRGFGLAEVGDNAAAERLLAETVATAERLDLPYLVATSSANYALVLLRLGRIEPAIAMIRTAISAFVAQKDARTEGVSRVYLAMMLAERGELAAAETEARAALVLCESIPSMRPTTLGVLASIQLREGKTEALATAAEAMQVLEAGGTVEEGEALLRLVYARALMAAGDRAAAETAIRRARARLDERASLIARPEWRASFLAGVPEHAQTLALARELLGEDG